ncbi:hypothetical protein RYX36_031261 [Vicia faba]
MNTRLQQWAAESQRNFNGLLRRKFFNERFVVEVLRVGVMVGVKSPVNWREEEKACVLVKKEDVEKAIEKLMDSASYEKEESRKRAKEIAKMI